MRESERRLPMNLGCKDGPLTPSLSPKGEREKTSQKLHRVLGLNARFYRGNLTPALSSLGEEREIAGLLVTKYHSR
jgi:hypothetical protein